MSKSPKRVRKKISIVCETCGYASSSKRSHLAHQVGDGCKLQIQRLLISANVKNKICNLCQKYIGSFATEHLFKVHGVGEPIATCKYCSAAFVRRNSFDKHLCANITGEKKNLIHISFRHIFLSFCFQLSLDMIIDMESELNCDPAPRFDNVADIEVWLKSTADASEHVAVIAPSPDKKKTVC